MTADANGEAHIVVTLPNALRGAFVKLERARAHLSELNARIDELARSRPYSAELIRENDGWERVVAHVEQLPDAELGAIYGDAASALRSSLDYLVNELAVLNGSKARRCKFPVFEAAADFDKKADRYLQGVHPDHVAAIRSLQPFNETMPRSHPLWQMSWISNRDKHRELQAVWILPRESVNDLALTTAATGLEAEWWAGPVVDGTAVLSVRSQPPMRLLRKGVCVLEPAFGDLLLTADHSRIALGYVLWTLTTFAEAWGPATWRPPDEMRVQRRPVGPGVIAGELVLVVEDHAGAQRTIRIPVRAVGAGDSRAPTFDRSGAGS